MSPLKQVWGNILKRYRATWFAREKWDEAIITALVLALIIRTFAFQAYKIPSGSMIPTLKINDRLMVNKFRYGPKVIFRWGDKILTSFKRLPGFGQPKRGDIIVFIYPMNVKKDFIKRLIALGGETVEIINGDIYIDNELVTDARIKNIYYYNRGEYGQRGSSVKVPEGYVFVLGDNSQSSHDSRYWGFVPEENIIGRAEVIYWPPGRIRFLK